MTRPYPERTHSATVIDGYHCGRCGCLYQKRSEAERCCGLGRGTKSRILKRDRMQCVICGSTASLNVHHFEDGHHGYFVLDEKVGSPYHNTRDEELVTLCVSCHMKVHAMPDKTLAKLLTEIVAQRFGKQKASLMVVKEDGTIDFSRVG